ncbi:MAG TPA: hypothetical protein VIW80_13440 [Pyrinomonadaceae bacterium]
MIILDKPKPFNGSTITLPLYHRGHLSFFPGAKVWLCLIPRANRNQTSELVVSPIEHSAWSDLWRISLTLRERVGLVHDVFQIMADKSFNILTAESTTKDGMSLHAIEMIANARLYSSQVDLTHEQRSTEQLEQLKDLRTEFLARLIDDIALLPDGEPRIRIRRVRGLLNARRNYNAATEQVSTDEELRPIVREAKVIKAENQDKVIITLPDELRNLILKSLGSPNGSGDSKSGSYLSVSNTSERFLNIYFIRDSDSVIAPTIEHQDEIGALAKITAAIQDGGFNILTTLSRLQQWETKARTEFVLQPPQRYLNKLSTESIKRRLEDALSTPELVHNYGLRIGYPINYISPVKTKQLRVKGEMAKGKKVLPIEAQPRISAGRSISSIINLKKRDLNRRREQRGEGAEDALRRYHLLEDLEVEQSISEATSTRRVLFISYSFKAIEMINKVAKIAKRFHFDVRIAKKLGGAATTREGIMTMMDDCTHFLGIWTEEGGTRVGKGYFPSPWLHWEWGVAEALGLDWHLLISNKINEQAWKRIAGDTPHNIFSMATFDEELKDSLISGYIS